MAVIPNGTYGVNGPRGEYVVFTVRNRKLRNLAFQIQVTCQASDSPTSEQRFFTSTEAPESCDGVGSLRFRRGYEAAPPGV